MPSAPRDIAAPQFGMKPPLASESKRFESSFRGLSRVNESLTRNNSYPMESLRGERPHYCVRGESETGTCDSSRDQSGARRLGVTDHALHARESATPRALDLVDMLVHLDHAHRRRGAAVEVDDLAGIGVAHAHIMDVVDLAALGKAGERGCNGLHPFRRRVDAER